MSLIEIVRLREAKNRENLAKVKKWKKRMDKLSSRESSPMTEKDFCTKYGIHAAHFNNIKNLKCTTMPKDRIIELVETSFEKEGV